MKSIVSLTVQGPGITSQIPLLIVIELESRLHPKAFVTTQENVVGALIVLVIDGVIPEGLHAKV